LSAIASPRLTLPETVFNFGYVPQNSQVSHSFWLLSTGDETLNILNVIPGCSCTKAPLQKNVLAVGDSTILEIIFSTKSFRNRVEKSPKIVTNEGQPDKRLKIIATVVARPDSTFPVVIQPSRLELPPQTDRAIEFSIQNVSEAELNLELLSVPARYFEVILPGTIKPGEAAKARLQLNKTLLDKSFEKSFTFMVNDEYGSRFTVPVRRKSPENYDQLPAGN
jgi:hypothetical protein